MEPNTIVTICTAIGTIITILAFIAAMFRNINSKLDKMAEELRSQGQRISRIEGFLEGTFQTRLPPIKKAQGEE